MQSTCELSAVATAVVILNCKSQFAMKDNRCSDTQ